MPASNRSRANRPNERLQMAQDPNVMREILERHLQSPQGPGIRIRQCEVDYLRGGDGARLAVQYRLRLEELETGRESDRVVSGLSYGPGRTLGVWKSLGVSAQSPGVGESTMPLPPFSYLSDLDLLIQVFPFDYQLPGLATVMAGPPAEFLPPILAVFGAGSWQVVAWEVEPVRYRVDQRATLRLRVQARDSETGRSEERWFYIKVFRDRTEGQRGYASHRALAEAVAAAGTPFMVAEPVVYVEDLSLLAQSELAGTSLHTILRQLSDALPAVRAAARAVAALHQLPLAAATVVPMFDQVARVKSGAERIRSIRPDLALDVDRLIEAMLHGDEEEPRPIHGDLTLGHVLLDGERVGLIDFDLLAAGDPLRDVTTFAIHLAKTRSRVKKGRDPAGETMRAFIDEYLVHAPEAWRARLPDLGPKPV